MYKNNRKGYSDDALMNSCINWRLTGQRGGFSVTLLLAEGTGSTNMGLNYSVRSTLI